MNVRLQRRFAFTAGAYFNNQLLMTDYEFKITMITNSYDPESHNIAFERVKFFITNCLDSTIFINKINFEQCKKLALADLNVTTLPEEPIDQIVGIMLYCKLNAIMEDQMYITDLEIESGLGDHVVYLHNEEESLGPFAQPGWWNDADMIHAHHELVGVDRVIELRNNTTWKQFDLDWPNHSDAEPTGNVVVFPDFKRDETE